MNYFNNYKNICFWFVKETSPQDIFLRTQNICLIGKKLLTIIFGGLYTLMSTSI